MAQAVAVDADLPDAEADAGFLLPIERHPLAVERQAAAADQAVRQRGGQFAQHAIRQRQDAQVAAKVLAAVDEVGIVMRGLHRGAPDEKNFVDAGQQLAQAGARRRGVRVNRHDHRWRHGLAFGRKQLGKGILVRDFFFVRDDEAGQMRTRTHSFDPDRVFALQKIERAIGVPVQIAGEKPSGDALQVLALLLLIVDEKIDRTRLPRGILEVQEVLPRIL